MFQTIINLFYPKPDFLNIILNEIKTVQLKTDIIDRNYHHYIITDHTQKRMQERKISYFEIHLAFQYGKFTDNYNEPNVKKIELNVSDLPKSVLDGLNNNQIKAITRICPITLIVDLKNKIVKTVYPNNKTNFKEKVISDFVRKSRNNKYTKKIKGKLIDEEKKQRKLAKKLRPYKEIDV